MNRIPTRHRGYAFYIPRKNAREGAAVQDAYGSTYAIQKDGSLRLNSQRKHCTKNKI